MPMAPPTKTPSRLPAVDPTDPHAMEGAFDSYMNLLRNTSLKDFIPYPPVGLAPPYRGEAWAAFWDYRRRQRIYRGEVRKYRKAQRR